MPMKEKISLKDFGHPDIFISKSILKISGLTQLMGPSLFIIGILAHNWPLMLVGGLIMVVCDLSVVTSGTEPSVLLCIMVFAIIFALIIHPWYYGVFWSLFVFQVLNIPGAIKSLTL